MSAERDWPPATPDEMARAMEAAVRRLVARGPIRPSAVVAELAGPDGGPAVRRAIWRVVADGHIRLDAHGSLVWIDGVPVTEAGRRLVSDLMDSSKRLGPADVARSLVAVEAEARAAACADMLREALTVAPVPDFDDDCDDEQVADE